MKHSAIKLALYITFALSFTAYTHLDIKERKEQAINYIQSHSDGSDTSINNAINEARVIYKLPYYIVEELENSFYL